MGPLVLHKLLSVLPCPHRNHHPGGLVHGEQRLLPVTRYTHADIQKHRMGNMSSSEKIHTVCRILSKGWIFESIPLLLKKKTKPYYLEMITFFTSFERLYKWTLKYSLYFVIFIHLWCIHIESKVADVLVYLQRPVINEQCFYRTGISHWVLI